MMTESGPVYMRNLHLINWYFAWEAIVFYTSLSWYVIAAKNAFDAATDYKSILSPKEDYLLLVCQNGINIIFMAWLCSSLQ